MKLSQFTRCSEPDDHYLYTENALKNRQGGFAQLSKLPEEAKIKHFFYARPLPAIPTDYKKPWFVPVPVGKIPKINVEGYVF